MKNLVIFLVMVVTLSVSSALADEVCGKWFKGGYDEDGNLYHNRICGNLDKKQDGSQVISFIYLTGGQYGELIAKKKYARKICRQLANARFVSLKTKISLSGPVDHLGITWSKISGSFINDSGREMVTLTTDMTAIDTVTCR